MTQSLSLDDMDEVSKGEAKACVDKVLQLTRGLNLYFKDKWEGWQALWTEVCMDAELYSLLRKISPSRNNDWGLNQKMVCNVVGICVNRRLIEAPINALNKALTTKQVSSYISQPGDFCGSNSAFAKEQYGKVEQLVNDHLS